MLGVEMYSEEDYYDVLFKREFYAHDRPLGQRCRLVLDDLEDDFTSSDATPSPSEESEQAAPPSDGHNFTPRRALLVQQARAKAVTQRATASRGPHQLRPPERESPPSQLTRLTPATWSNCVGRDDAQRSGVTSASGRTMSHSVAVTPSSGGAASPLPFTPIHRHDPGGPGGRQPSAELQGDEIDDLLGALRGFDPWSTRRPSSACQTYLPSPRASLSAHSGTSRQQSPRPTPGQRVPTGGADPTRKRSYSSGHRGRQAVSAVLKSDILAQRHDRVGSRAALGSLRQTNEELQQALARLDSSLREQQARCFQGY